MADSYRRLRERWKPDRVRLLLIGESAPDPGAAEVRFFYAPRLTAYDNLFRGVILALYGRSPGRASDPKRPWLEALLVDGVYLIDVVPFPVNQLSRKQRRQALRDHAGNCVAQAALLRPQTIAICHGRTFHALRPSLLLAGQPLIHQQPLPFPQGNWRQQFAAGLRAAVEQAGLRFRPPAARRISLARTPTTPHLRRAPPPPTRTRPRVCAIAWRAQRRLYSQWLKLTGAGRHQGIAVVACARELSGFLWEAAILP